MLGRGSWQVVEAYVCLLEREALWSEDIIPLESLSGSHDTIATIQAPTILNKSPCIAFHHSTSVTRVSPELEMLLFFFLATKSFAHGLIINLCSADKQSEKKI